jgi:hypothetical protein
MLAKTHGHFVYALDDTYIHLALAENLAKGHYGLNSQEYSSPSSSILWPFLLIPFAGTRLHVFLPFAWNILFGTMAAGIVGAMVAKWPLDGRLKLASPSWQQYTAAIFLILIANLASLTFIGMEHVLQVLTAICCAYGVIEALHERPIPAWCLVAAAVSPMIRYEDLSLSLALCCAAIGVRRWKAGVALFAVTLVPLLAFSAFLKSKGMPALPMSVLAKGHDFANAGAADKLVFLLKSSPRQDLIHPDHYSTVVLFFIFLVLMARASTPLRRWAFFGATALAFLQLTLGRFGWFHRYEVYALIFLLCVGLSVADENRRIRFAYLIPCLLFCAFFYIAAIVVTPSSSDGIYLQQYQMRRYLVDYFNGDYAVNDLGLVSFQRRPGTYVLDLQGLASTVPVEKSARTAAWLEGLLRQHGVDLAIVFPQWFDVPKSWTPIGRLCIHSHEYVHNSEKCVVFYSANHRSDASIRTSLARFSCTLPPKAVYTAY